MRRWMFGGASALIVTLALAWLAAPDSLLGQPQRPNGQRPNGPGGPNRNPGDDKKEEESYAPPEDPKLRKIHQDFLTEATKLVVEYDKKKDYEKLRAVCEDILRIMPKHPGAEEMLKKIRAEESTAESEKVEILATKGWQETGIIVQEGKPVSIKATGTWTFNVETDLGPAGMEIPKEWREFNLGSLIGFVYTGDMKDVKPFAIGDGIEFTADKTGPLFLKMHDSNPEDNKGKLQVEIKGTFKKGRAGSSS